MEMQKPDWCYWKRQVTISALDAMHLTLGYDPCSDRRTPPSVLRRLLEYNAAHLTLAGTVADRPLREITDWAIQNGWNIPVRMAAYATTAWLPSPVKPAPLPLIDAILVECAAYGIEAQQIRAEVERLGCRFVMANDRVRLHRPDGTIHGCERELNYEALSELFALGLCAPLGIMLSAMTPTERRSRGYRLPQQTSKPVLLLELAPAPAPTPAPITEVNTTHQVDAAASTKRYTNPGMSPEQIAEAIRLRSVEKLTPGAIGKRLGFTRQTIRVRLGLDGKKGPGKVSTRPALGGNRDRGTSQGG